jgi:hypothetical protein
MDGGVMLISNLLDIMLSVLFFSQISGALCAPSIHQHDFFVYDHSLQIFGIFIFLFFLQDTILIGRLLGQRK